MGVCMSIHAQTTEEQAALAAIMYSGYTGKGRNKLLSFPELQCCISQKFHTPVAEKEVFCVDLDSWSGYPGTSETLLLLD